MTDGTTLPLRSALYAAPELAVRLRASGEHRDA